MVVFRGESTDTREKVSIKFSAKPDKFIEIMEVENNLECVVKRKNRLEEDKFEATAQIFYRIEVAQEYVRILKSLRSPYIAKAFFCVNTEYGAMAIVERLTSISDWVQTKNKSMWRLDKDGESAGFGFGFLDTLSQIMVALKSLHQAGYNHGNLWGGVHFGADNTIRLNNFGAACRVREPWDVLSDFTGVAALCSFWIASDPPSREVREVDYFFRFFRFSQYQSFPSDCSMTDVEIVVKFIYKLPKMFHKTAIAVLFTTMHQLKSIVAEDGQLSSSFTDMSKYYHDNWSNRISTQQLLNVLYHPKDAPTINPNDANLNVDYCLYYNVQNKAYLRPGGIKTFARNALPHTGENSAQAVDFVLNDFPVLHLQFFLELVQNANLKTVVLIKGKHMQFHEYLSDVLLLDDVTRYQL